jgi:hypothetical protein
MPRLSEDQKEKLRTQTVEVLLSLRRSYLQTSGKNVRKNWDILISRTRAAAVTTTSPEEWYTEMLRGLKIESISVDSSNCLAELVDTVADAKCQREWLDLLEREWGHLFAMARRLVEERKAAAETAEEA